MDELDEPRILKDYLLGTLDDESVQGRIEERLMVDEEFAVRLSAAEDELIEQFLDGELSDADADRFQTFFLAPPERRSQFRLTRDLRRVAVAKAKLPSPHSIRSQSSRGLWAGWLRFSAAAAAILIAALGIWRFAIYESDADKGLDALRAAYRDYRPVEPRLTGLTNYAPFPETRGDQVKVTDPSALDSAGLFFASATRGSSDATAHQGLATYYLARGETAAAEREIKAALEASPTNARIQNDAGATYLQIARNATDDANELIALNDSLTHLNRAVALDSTLVDAYFNRALALEALRDTEEAKAAWRRYIEVDPSSKWTDEARQHLQRLENSTPKERSAKEIEEDFLAAYKDGRSSEAEKLIASNREAIRDKYLPVRLAMSFVSAGDERRDELLKALEYCGEIEMKMTGDPFAKEIAFFYHNVPREKLDSLAEAHRGLRDGYDLLLNRLDYRDALPIFQSSQKTFDESGDVYSAKLAQYFAAYALANLNHNDEALTEMTRVSNWAGERKFSWLSMTALHWVASCQLNSKQLTEARRSYEQALAIAETIGDSYGKQRNLSLLAYLHSICGQQKEALKYLFASVKESDTPETSLRQRYRNLFFVLPILIQAGLFSAGEPAAIEAMKSADRQNDAMWMTQSRALAGIASAQMGDLAAARAMLDDSRSKAAAIQSTDARERMGAFARLRSADFERLYGGDLATAERLYKEALQYYDAGALPSLREEARQGLLQTYLATGNSNALAAEIPANISLAEEYRTKILDEEQTISFFDLKANVYDVAAEFEFNNGNLERAYDHVEASSSRALLNRMQRRSSVTSKDLPPSSPLNLSEIRTELPAGVRIVQYSVFEKKVVVWIVSRDGLNAVPIPVDAVHLSDLVSRFSQGVSNQATADSSETKRLGVELYELLILPILSYLDPHDELCIIPSKFLFDVPFAALTDSEGKPLISTFRLVHAPSANVFLTGSRNAAARQRSQDESLLAVGNPAFDRERFENLTYLPDSEQETERIARLYPGAQALIGERATKKAFLNALSDSDVIHFAGHYVAMPGTPMASFLLLATDGGDPTNSELSNSELLGMSLSRARLIVLAACRSGIESYYRSEGMAGMSRTMLAAQVPLVVASQWSVDSAATAAMMIRFHELRRQEHMPTTAALRAAQLDLINDPSGKYSSPYYWAAFAVYGGHAEF